MGFPTVYPTGTTVYDPEKTNNGYTVISRDGKTDIMTMNGEVVSTTKLNPTGESIQVATQLLTKSRFSSLPVLDSQITICDAQSRTVWQWAASDHFTEFGFDATAENAIYRLIEENSRSGWQTPWLTIESVRRLGNNVWYDAGDSRFDPDNLIFSAPNANIVAIISSRTGHLVWQLGPTYTKTPVLRQLGWLINPTNAQLIDSTLPGAGNLLVFDQGGAAGYGAVSGLSRDGIHNQHREYSRILEINPTTLNIEWQYTPTEAGNVQPLDAYKLYSPQLGGVQRLENGNTLILEGLVGRLFEITPAHETVWEYVSPDFKTLAGGAKVNHITGMQRIAYAQLDLPRPSEKPVAQLNVTNLRVPGSPNGANAGKVTVVDGVDPQRLRAVRDPHSKQNLTKTSEHDFCVVTFGGAAKH